MIGDVVGKPGRRIVRKALPGLIERESLDLVVANGENAAGGSGLTCNNYRELIQAGVDGITLGDHVYKRREIVGVLNGEDNIVKPANFPETAPGRNLMLLPAKNGETVAVFCALGRLFMRPVDCPWTAAERVLAEVPDTVKIILVDFHAETTSEMQLMGRFLDGKATAVLGTHTHVATADEQILPGGTAFQCDVGMTGPHESILGRRVDRVMEATLTFYPRDFEVATNDVRMCGTIVDLDPATGKATAIRRLCVREEEAEELAAAARRSKRSQKQSPSKQSPSEQSPSE
ncbi:MAG: YmdB family metallophosphoesterase [Planctomycetales bacterium]